MATRTSTSPGWPICAACSPSPRFRCSSLRDVLDDGPGFESADADRVFEAGVTGGDGCGLGLPVVRRIAASAGVEVRAVTDGRGHVRVTLPAARAAT
ncbi:sensor histidine kinase [Streptomyces griseoluteus]